MTEPNEHHPALDQDLVERYVLLRLTEAEREAFDEHLRRCDRCREALNDERRIALGVRLFAEEEMKGRLAQRVAGIARRDTSWVRIAVAASIFLAAGIGFYRLWLGTLSEPEEAQPAVVEKRAAPPEENQNTLSRDLAPSKTFKRREKPQAEPPARKQLRTPEHSSPTLSEGFWTEGFVLNERGQFTGSLSKGMAEAAPATKKEDHPAPQATERNELVRSSGTTLQILLRQEPARSVPQHRARPHRGIPIYAQALGTGLQLTLYPDSLFPPSDLARATVHQISNDSLIILIGRQTIGTKVPDQLLSRQVRE
jgi:anti-sigma factor RsiW